MRRAKSHANGTCQVSGVRRTPANPFELDVHHLFDRAERPDLADFYDNLLVMHEDIHDGFHSWRRTKPCEPRHFAEYLTVAESHRFTTPAKERRLHRLMIRLARLQHDFENHFRY